MSRSTMAFFTMAWQSGTLWSWLVRLLPVTGKASSLPKNSSQGQRLGALEQLLEGPGG